MKHYVIGKRKEDDGVLFVSQGVSKDPDGNLIPNNFISTASEIGLVAGDMLNDVDGDGWSIIVQSPAISGLAPLGSNQQNIILRTLDSRT
jgi:hypothetical protein